PLAGSAVKLVGMTASNSVLAVGSTVVNAAGGAMAYLTGGITENAVNSATGHGSTFQPSAQGALLNAVTAGAFGAGLSARYPVTGNTMRTLKQAEHFMPGRNPATIVQSVRVAGNAQNLYWRQTLLSVGLGSVSGAGIEKWILE
ncbi:MAG: hypothetical protein N2508_13805, partial [Anaerolineae bacterium]|nr:hypothetical protein [Anaerolineae bacterium]